MAPITALERFLERLFERPSARLFRAHLQPAQLERQVDRAQLLERRDVNGRSVTPNVFAVHLHPTDLAGLPPGTGESLARHVLVQARRQGLTLLGRPTVELVADASTTPGAPVVAASIRRDGRGPGRSRPGEGAPLPAVGPPSGEAAIGGPMAPHHHGPTGDPPAAGERPWASLRVLGPSGEDRVDVQRPTFSIGRDRGNDLVIDDRAVSRQHARIQARSGALVLTDLGSRNGTFVNGRRIDSIALGIGDFIDIGGRRLLVEPAADSWTQP